MTRLSGKVVAITGAGSGIAKAAAHLFAAQGAEVALLELEAPLGQTVASEINAAGGKAFFVQTDVTIAESVDGAMKTVAGHFGRLTTLFNCAGGSTAEDTQVTDDMTTRCAAAKLLVESAAAAYDRSDRCDMEAGMAKLFASEAAMENAAECMRIHGAYGYSREYHVERYYRDAPLMCIGEGTNEMQRIIIARQQMARNPA
ncbi:MAG: SDR family NAD(P)-dependent oxidoreductase [Gammaproteobacteria bacterium]